MGNESSKEVDLLSIVKTFSNPISVGVQGISSAYETFQKALNFLGNNKEPTTADMVQMLKKLEDRLNQVELGVQYIHSELALSTYSNDETNFKFAINQLKLFAQQHKNLSKNNSVDDVWRNKTHELEKSLQHYLEGMPGGHDHSGSILEAVKRKCNGCAFEIHATLKRLFALVDGAILSHVLYTYRSGQNSDVYKTAPLTIEAVKKLYNTARMQALQLLRGCLTDFSSSSLKREIQAITRQYESESHRGRRVQGIFCETKDYVLRRYRDIEEEASLPKVRWVILASSLDRSPTVWWGITPSYSKWSHYLKGISEDYYFFADGAKTLVLFFPVVDQSGIAIPCSKPEMTRWLENLDVGWFGINLLKKSVVAETIANRITSGTYQHCVVIEEVWDCSSSGQNDSWAQGHDGADGSSGNDIHVYNSADVYNETVDCYRILLF